MTYIFPFHPTRNLKVVFYPTRNPKASQWNIGCVVSLALGLCVGHVHFIFFVLISFALGSRRKRSFQWNMGLSCILLTSRIFSAEPLSSRPCCSGSIFVARGVARWYVQLRTFQELPGFPECPLNREHLPSSIF